MTLDPCIYNLCQLAKMWSVYKNRNLDFRDCKNMISDFRDCKNVVGLSKTSQISIEYSETADMDSWTLTIVIECSITTLESISAVSEKCTKFYRKYYYFRFSLAQNYFVPTQLGYEYLFSCRLIMNLLLLSQRR